LRDIPPARADLDFDGLEAVGSTVGPDDEELPMEEPPPPIPPPPLMDLK